MIKILQIGLFFSFHLAFASGSILHSARQQLSENGFIASDNFAQIINCEKLLPELKSMFEQDWLASNSYDDDSFSKFCGEQLWTIKAHIDRDKNEIRFNFTDPIYETKLKGYPSPLIRLVRQVAKLLDDGDYYISVLIISDNHFEETSEEHQTHWHQDKFPSEYTINVNDELWTVGGLFNYLFFMEVERIGFGNGDLELGLAPNIILDEISYSKKAIAVHESEVSVLQRIAGINGAGYFINQDFETPNGKRIVHRSPLIGKKKGGRRYKIILRIKKL